MCIGLLLLLAFQLRSNDFQANRQLGEQYIHHKNFQAALPYLEKAYSINPDDYVNAFDLTTLYLTLGKASNARAIVTALLQKTSKAELHNLLAEVEEAEGHNREAAEEYEVAARMDPSEKNLFDLGTELLNHGVLEPARKVFIFATEKYPKSVRLQVGLGVIYYSLSQYDEAVAALCRAVDLDPTDAKAFDFLGKMYDISPHYANAVSTRLAQFVKSYPASPAANYYYALSLRKVNAAVAEKFLRKAVHVDPAFTAAHYELGLLCENSGKFNDAITHYQTAIRQQPNLGKAHYRLARLYAKAGNATLARQEFAIVEKLKTNEH